MRDDVSLARLAEAVADGAAVDWEALQRLADEQDHLVLDQLRVLAAISTVHRTAEVGDSILTPIADEPALAAGDRWGPLRILDELGRGRQGSVYRALDEQLQREVALKLVPIRWTSTASDRLEEARLLARVRHPNVVTVYGADRIGGRIGLWMELVAGETLAARLATGGPFGGEEAAIVGATVCRALAAVHREGLIHRDVKAQNIMRASGGRIVLMDFGAVRPAADEDHRRRAIGTPAYLAPEVLAGAPASVKSDLYSLGVLLFFLTTKRFPVIAETLEELKARHRQGQVLALRDLRPDLPEPFVAAVTRALAPLPADRFETAGKLEEALTLLHAPVSLAAPVSATTRPGTADRRGPWWRTWRAVAAAAVLAGVALAALWTSSPNAPPPVDGPSVAVLPLRNLSGDPGKAYLADSLTEVLITQLAKIRGVRVLSFPVVAPFASRDSSPAEAGAALGVQYLLAGGIATEGNTIRTTVQLVDARSGATIWAEEYARAAQDLLGQQAEIVRTVAARLRLDLRGPAAAALQPRPALAREAQEAYFQGLATLLQSPAVLDPSQPIAFFERAVAVEPGFAEAWAALSQARVALINRAIHSNRIAAYEQARADALRAIDLNPNLGAGHSALATVRFQHDWDWDGAEASFAKAVELTPGDAGIRRRYALFLAAAGRLNEAVAWAESSRDIEPLNPLGLAIVGTVYHYARMYEEGIREVQHALALAPGLASAHYRLCRIYSGLGRLDEARAACDATVAAGNALDGLLELARVHALAGRREDAERTLAAVAALPIGPNVNPDNLAFVHAALDDHDRAFALLDEAVARRAPNLLWIQHDARFDPLRGDPRFAALLRQVVGAR